MISVIVLAYNSAEFICDCVSALLADRWSYPEVEIVVFDNASQDSTEVRVREAFSGAEGVILGGSPRALGYAGGNNIAALLAKGEILLFLNDDCVVEPGALRSLADDFVADETMGVVQCAVATADGSRWDTLGHSIDSWGLLRPIASGLARQELPNRPREIFAGSGAALAVRRPLFDQLGGFDDSFGFLFEETDLCWRARLLGYRVAVSGRAVVRHRQLARYQQAYRGRQGSAYYLLTRNRIRSLMKNYSRRRLLTNLGPHLALVSAYSVRELFRGHPACAVDALRALAWNARRLVSTLRLRKQIQRRRVVSDKELIQSGLMTKAAVSQLMNHPLWK